MQKKIGIYVPTRHRPEKSEELLQSHITNSTCSELIYVLDDDDSQNYPRLHGARYIVVPSSGRVGMTDPLNTAIMKDIESGIKYDYICFMGDDHRPRTKNWDSILIDRVQNIPMVVAYGNDLLQGERVPTAVIMDSKIVQTLGWISPPCLQHLYIDNFWKALGNQLGTLTYFEDIIIEHMHYTRGKSEEDEMYKCLNATEMFANDKAKFEEYRSSEFKEDLNKLRIVMGK